MGHPNSLTEDFLKYGLYVRNWSPRTVESYRASLRDCPSPPTKANLNAHVVAMRERGLSPGGIREMRSLTVMNVEGDCHRCPHCFGKWKTETFGSWHPEPHTQ